MCLETVKSQRVSEIFACIFGFDAPRSLVMNARFEAYMAVKIQVEVIWVVLPCSEVGPPKRRYPTATLHGVRTQKTWT
jgi:hypothetical protein